MPTLVTLALAGQLALAGPALPVSPGSIRLTSAQMFEVAERAFTAGNASFGERALQALAADPDPAVRAEARFRLARQFMLDGRERDAAVLYRRILDDQPDAARVRLELAALLQQFGDEQGALRELRALRTSDLPPTVARFVDRLSASLQASKPFGVQVEFALAPDSLIAWFHELADAQKEGLSYDDAIDRMRDTIAENALEEQVLRAALGGGTT